MWDPWADGWRTPLLGLIFPSKNKLPLASWAPTATPTWEKQNTSDHRARELVANGFAERGQFIPLLGKDSGPQTGVSDLNQYDFVSQPTSQYIFSWFHFCLPFNSMQPKDKFIKKDILDPAGASLGYQKVPVRVLFTLKRVQEEMVMRELLLVSVPKCQPYYLPLKSPCALGKCSSTDL